METIKIKKLLQNLDLFSQFRRYLDLAAVLRPSFS